MSWLLRALLAEALATLTAAGVGSPRTDAELLAAHVLGVARSRLWLVREVSDTQTADIRALVARRVTREPLQHLLGTAPLGPIEVEVGPGVFVPRPETESLYAWAVAALAPVRDPLVLELCAGTGALALAIAHTRPDAAVHAVELDPRALVWTRRNAEARARAGDTPVTVHAADATSPDLLPHLADRVDLIVVNPPYIPAGAELEPEVSRYDPHLALFGGADGLDVVRGLIPVIARLLRPGGAVGVEHDDSNGAGAAELLAAHGFDEVAGHADLAGRPRYVTARRASAAVGVQRDAEANDSDPVV